MKDGIFKALILIRIIFPPLIFSLFHPFISIVMNEFVLDGLISPHHFFTKFIPDDIKGHHKLKYDIFVDGWGFLNSLIPVLCKGNKYYHVFDGYRLAITSSLMLKFLGMVLVYKFKDYRLQFPFLFYLPMYISISFCNFFKIKNRGKVTAIFIVLFLIREVYLCSVNKTL